MKRSTESQSENSQQANERKSRGRKERGDTPSPSAGAGSGARPSSVGARARNDALLQRRIQTLEDIRSLNAEIVELQKKLLKMLKSNPLFVPHVTPKQKRQVFAVLSELLGDIVMEISSLPGVSSQDLIKKIKFELLTWLQSEQESGELKNALGDIRTGMLRMAMVIDREAVTVLLEQQFLVKISTARPDIEQCVRDMIQTHIDGLQKWITA